MAILKTITEETILVNKTTTERENTNEEKEFLNRYKEKWQSSSLINIDAWPIINLIREMLKEMSVFEDSVSNLHKRLKDDAKEAGIEFRGKESGFPSDRLVPLCPVRWRCAARFLRRRG